MKECNQYDNWCEKEKRSCKNCYYERGYNMSDEEKKAIESLIEIREFANLSSYKDTKISQLNAIDVVLNLIEKQFKEIEILNKNMNLLREQNISYKQSIHGLKEMNKIINKNWEDKIKAKIEEIEKRRLQDGECELALHEFQREAKLEVLQSLLNEEE